MNISDFHTHILPGIDDGCTNCEESIALLRREAEGGIARVIATPHFYPSRRTPAGFLLRRAEAYERLTKAMRGEDGLPKLLLGAEVHFFEGISDCEALEKLAIEGTSCVLIEMPMQAWSERNLLEVSAIYQKQKLTPILAHIERYRHIPLAKELLYRTHDLPVLLQANAEFFCSVWTRKRAILLLREGKIDLVGSDCHDLLHRKPNLDAAIRAIRHSAPDALHRVEQTENRVFSAVSSNSDIGDDQT